MKNFQEVRLFPALALVECLQILFLNRRQTVLCEIPRGCISTTDKQRALPR